MIAAALILASPQVLAPPPIYTVRETTDAEFCAMGDRLAKSLQPELPKMVDSSTRIDGIVALCAVRTLTWNKTLMAVPSDMRDGWQGRKQAQWNAIVCGNTAFAPMYRRGWTFTQNLTFQDGTRVVMDAKCA